MINNKLLKCFLVITSLSLVTIDGASIHELDEEPASVPAPDRPRSGGGAAAAAAPPPRAAAEDVAKAGAEYAAASDDIPATTPLLHEDATAATLTLKTFNEFKDAPTEIQLDAATITYLTEVRRSARNISALAEDVLERLAKKLYLTSGYKTNDDKTNETLQNLYGIITSILERDRANLEKDRAKNGKISATKSFEVADFEEATNRRIMEIVGEKAFKDRQRLEEKGREETLSAAASDEDVRRSAKKDVSPRIPKSALRKTTAHSEPLPAASGGAGSDAPLGYSAKRAVRHLLPLPSEELHSLVNAPVGKPTFETFGFYNQELFAGLKNCSFLIFHYSHAPRLVNPRERQLDYFLMAHPQKMKLPKCTSPCIIEDLSLTQFDIDEHFIIERSPINPKNLSEGYRGKLVTDEEEKTAIARNILKAIDGLTTNKEIFPVLCWEKFNTIKKGDAEPFPARRNREVSVPNSASSSALNRITITLHTLTA